MSCGVDDEGYELGYLIYSDIPPDSPDCNFLSSTCYKVSSKDWKLYWQTKRVYGEYIDYLFGIKIRKDLIMEDRYDSDDLDKDDVEENEGKYILKGAFKKYVTMKGNFIGCSIGKLGRSIGKHYSESSDGKHYSESSENWGNIINIELALSNRVIKINRTALLYMEEVLLWEHVPYLDYLNSIPEYILTVRPPYICIHRDWHENGISQSEYDRLFSKHKYEFNYMGDDYQI